MKRFTLLLPIAALVLVGACADTPSAPQSFDRPQLDESPPPPPRLDGATGFVNFAPDDFSGQAVGATPGGPEDCEVPILAFPVEGTYFQNKPATHAYAHISPVGGSGNGIINETETRADASGKLEFEGAVIRLIEWRPAPGGELLNRAKRSDGFAYGELVAEITACGSTNLATGTFSYSWGSFIGR